MSTEEKETGTVKEETAASAIPDGLSIEEAFEELKSILNAMQDNSISLEESFAQYEKGMRLIRYCSGKIDGVEKKIEKLSADGTLVPLDAPE